MTKSTIQYWNPFLPENGTKWEPIATWLALLYDAAFDKWL